MACAAASNLMLPTEAITELESGRAVVLKNWLPRDEMRALYEDASAMHGGGHFSLDALASYAVKRGSPLEQGNDRMTMPSFSASKGTDGPWANYDLGNGEARRRFRARITALRSALASDLHDRPTLAVDARRTHEISYTRYGAGARLPRHTDEHHGELKRAHSVASGDENLKRLRRQSGTDSSAMASSSASRSATGGSTRRSVTWLVYLNEDWDVKADGGQLRLHERAQASCSLVGAHEGDLQVQVALFQHPFKAARPPFPTFERGDLFLYLLDTSGWLAPCDSRPSGEARVP